MFFEKSKNPKISEKKSMFREKMKVLEFSADHFGYGMVKIREISCFRKIRKSKNQRKKSLFREKMKVLEFSADHFGYGTVKIREISCFSKNPKIQKS